MILRFANVCVRFSPSLIGLPSAPTSIASASSAIRMRAVLIGTSSPLSAPAFFLRELCLGFDQLRPGRLDRTSAAARRPSEPLDLIVGRFDQPVFPGRDGDKHALVRVILRRVPRDRAPEAAIVERSNQVLLVDRYHHGLCRRLKPLGFRFRNGQPVVFNTCSSECVRAFRG